MASTGTTPTTFEASDRKLVRALSLQQLFFLSMGAIIGSGWLFAVLSADATAGPAVILSWIIGGVLVLLVALNYAEVAGALPRSGAIVRYPHLTHGGYSGFILGWAYLLSAVTVPAIEAEAVVTYISSQKYLSGLSTTSAGVTVLTGTGIVLAVILMAIFFAVNYFGIRLLGRWNQVFTWWKFVIPTLTFILLFFTFHASNFTAYGGFAPLGVKNIFLAIATSGIVFSFLGFRQALDYGGEARNPQRDVPLSTILSVVVAVVLYTLLQLAFTGSLLWSKLGIKVGDWAGLSKSSWATAPFYNALHQSGLALLVAFATLLLIDAVVSPSGTGWIYLGTSTRVLYGMSVDGYLPRPLQWISENFRVPWVALIASAVIGALFFLPLPGWYLLVGFISSATVLTYIMGGIGMQVLRRTASELHRPFFLPGAAILGPLGTLAAAMIVYWSSFAVLKEVVAAVFVGLPLYTWFYAPARRYVSLTTGLVLGIIFLIVWIVTQYYGPMNLNSLSFPLYFALSALEVILFSVAVWWLSAPEGKQTVTRAAWLLFLILATYLLSYYGAYGPKSTPTISFPLDDIIELAIGLVGYYWGVASGYETAELNEIVTTGTAVVPTEVA